MTDQPVPVRGTTCPICQETWEALYATFRTWLERPFDPLYSAAHNAAIETYLHHRLTGHLRAGKEKQPC